ncbi:MAG: hypothetical protein RL682_289 [Pseudomonadota bacterium]
MLFCIKTLYAIAMCWCLGSGLAVAQASSIFQGADLKFRLFPDEVTAVAAVLNRDHYKFK